MKHFFPFSLLILFAQFTFAQQAIVSSDIYSTLQETNKVSCIIQLNDTWQAPGFIKNWNKEEKTTFVFNALKEHNTNSQMAIVSYLENQSIDFQPYVIFNGLSAKLDKVQIDYILEHFEIKSIAYDKNVQQQFPRNGAFAQRMPTEWGIRMIQADSVWNIGFEGQEVTVAGQDTGYDFDNSLIVDKYRGYDGTNFDHNYNWHDAIHELNPLHEDPDDNPMNNPCGLDSVEPCDDHGHGTHTMGTMVGQDEENGIGVAPKANWISCRNMDRGWGKPSTYTECFEWFLAPTDLNNENPDPTKAPHVINNSWGCPTIEGCNVDNWMFMEEAVNNLVAAGIVVVVSAGNDGSNGCGSINRPASMFENSFVVGASAQNDTIAAFSSYGPIDIDSSYRWKPDVVAPGVNVRSITLDGFGTWSGTSMAGPHVAGAVALIISANPSLAGQVEEIQNILKETAKPITDTIFCDGISADQVPNFRYGHGRINVYEAVKIAQTWTSVKEVEKNESLFTIIPNPASSEIYLKLHDIDSWSGPIEVQVLSYDGKLIANHIVAKQSLFIDVSTLNQGMYYLSLKSAKNYDIRSFVKH